MAAMVFKGGKIQIVLQLFFLLLICHSSQVSADVNGGVNCAACDVIMALADQLSVIHNETITHALERLCSFLPDSFRDACDTFSVFIGPIITELIEEGDTPDVLCHKLGLCYTDPGQPECNLFPKKGKKFYHYSKDPVLAQKLKKYKMPKLQAGICDLPGIKEICDWINIIFKDHDPAVDLDGDRHSPYETLRGYAWRGKDCDDERRAFHPGARAIDEDKEDDSNCNGIKGADPQSGVPYEQTFCSKSDMRGVAVLGDSISAHFHLPREWFNSSEISAAAFEGLPYILENEIDWPAFSTVTGFMNATDTLRKVIHGNTDSIYHRLWQRNRCNFKDYQNIAVNGARSATMVDPIENSLFRDKTTDYPLIVFYALVGNDVCNGHPDTFRHMTTPEEMKKNIKITLNYLEKVLPMGSHVFLVALADGRVLYDNLKNRIHPIGSLKNDVTYSHFYDYFNCLQVSPCYGWMNSNQTIRDLTTKRAMELSAVLEEAAKNGTTQYKSFKVYYTPNPINQVIDEWTKQGKPAWQLLEPVDGFHANQVANAEMAKLIWRDLLQSYPEAVSEENPYNEEIHRIFGNQGGYK